MARGCIYLPPETNSDPNLTLPPAGWSPKHLEDLSFQGYTPLKKSIIALESQWLEDVIPV